MSFRASRAVVTLAVGHSFDPISTVTAPLMAAYARRIGAQFEVIRSAPSGMSNRMGKLALYELLEQYERIFYLDSDAIVLNDAPDIFATVPAAEFAATIVSAASDRHDDSIRETECVLGPVGLGRTCWNSGVMVISRAHREVFRPDAPELQTYLDFRKTQASFRFYDQPYFNYRVKQLGFPVYDLGYRWNHTRGLGRSPERFRSYVIHYAGRGHRQGDRERQIRADVFIAQRAPLRRLARVGLITWAFDRII